MTEPENRRKGRRQPGSCSLCRSRKVRCNRETPCSNCVRSRNGICVYDNANPSQSPSRHLGHGQTTEVGAAHGSGTPYYPSPIVDRASGISRASAVSSHPSGTLASSSASASSRADQPSTRDIESMKSRIRQLKEELSKATQSSTQSLVPTSDSNIETTSSRIAGIFHVNHDTRSVSRPQAITRNVMHKTRLFGQSHWINGVVLFQDLLEIIDPLVREETSKAISGIQRCKYLAKVIKLQRAPQWPPPKADLPPKDVSDELVDSYLRTTEAVYRILHVPSFRKDYEALWVSDTEPDAAFLVQVKLVLAIGAATYDERFSMRISAIQWVYEAQNWLSDPEFKSRLSIQSLQTNLLLLLAREITDVGGDLIWISAGALFRMAVYMGLHKDPTHLLKRSTFTAEMRRRLWNTILEITLQSSITSGGPPLVSLDDFDTKPPGNFDDDQLVAEDSVPKPRDGFTQMSVAIALRKTFPLRLAITKSLNDVGSHGTYEETLRLDTELRASYKVLRQTLQGYNSSSGRSPSQFEMRVVDFIMHRYLSSLHIPFFSSALQETIYAFSRKVVIETSLKIWCAAYPSSSIMATHQHHSNTSPPDRDDLARLTVCGSGFFRTVAFQASFVIAVELRSQLQEEESLGPVPLRPDLFSVLEDARTWSMRCIEAGETNIKGYLLMCAVGAQIKGLIRGLAKHDLAEALVRAVEEAEETCLPILEEQAAQGLTEGTTADTLSSNTLPDLTEDWDFMMSDVLFGDAEFNGLDV